GIVDSRHRVLSSTRMPTPTTGGPADVAVAMALAVREACQAEGREPSALHAVGVGSPGIVDPATGTVSSARNLPDWAGSFELGPTLAGELGTPVFVGNDVQVATDAEFRQRRAEDR